MLFEAISDVDDQVKLILDQQLVVERARETVKEKQAALENTKPYKAHAAAMEELSDARAKLRTLKKELSDGCMNRAQEWE